MNQIFIRLCGTVLAIWNFLIPAAHGYTCRVNYTSYCKQEDDVLVRLGYHDLPENNASVADPACSGLGPGGGSGSSKVVATGSSKVVATGSGTDIDTGCAHAGADCFSMDCTEGCKYDINDHISAFSTDAGAPIKYKYIHNGRVGFCSDIGIWMPYGHAKTFMPASYFNITGYDQGFRNLKDWVAGINEHEEIGTSPCVDVDGDSTMYESWILEYTSCSSGCYGDKYNSKEGYFECIQCPSTTYAGAKYSAKSPKTCTGPACCSISVPTIKDNTGTFTITNCPYEE